ncbi:MAG: FecR domain-containing protein, partial [Opitutus sp.]
HFLVARNPDRPFLVSAGPVAVRAVGTAFNVRLADRSIEVLVTEGEVRVERTDAFQATGVPESIEPLLAAGQMAVIDVPLGAAAPLAVSTRLPIEIDDALAWQTTRLAFNNTPLDEVVAAFNRYNAQKLVLGDAALRNRTLTGIFRADNLAGFTRLLRASVDVEARVRSGNSILLLPRRGD